MISARAHCKFFGQSTQLIALGLILFMTAPLAKAHQYNAAITSIEFNPRTYNLEIVHKLFADDMAQVLSVITGSKIAFGDLIEDDTQIRDYHEKHFALYGAEGKVPLQWIGAELDTDYLYIYQLLPGVNDITDFTVKNRLLFGYLHDQVNTLNYRSPQGMVSLVFTPAKTLAVIAK